MHEVQFDPTAATNASVGRGCPPDNIHEFLCKSIGWKKYNEAFYTI